MRRRSVTTMEAHSSSAVVAVAPFLGHAVAIADAYVPHQSEVCLVFLGSGLTIVVTNFISLNIVIAHLNTVTLLKQGRCPLGTEFRSVQACNAAAAYMKLPDTSAVMDEKNPYGDRYAPPFCYYQGRTLKFNAGSNSGRCSSYNQCLCAGDEASRPFDERYLVRRLPSQPSSNGDASSSPVWKRSASINASMVIFAPSSAVPTSTRESWMMASVAHCPTERSFVTGPAECERAMRFLGLEAKMLPPFGMYSSFEAHPPSPGHPPLPPGFNYSNPKGCYFSKSAAYMWFHGNMSSKESKDIEMYRIQNYGKDPPYFFAPIPMPPPPDRVSVCRDATTAAAAAATSGLAVVRFRNLDCPLFCMILKMIDCQCNVHMPHIIRTCCSISAAETCALAACTAHITCPAGKYTKKAATPISQTDCEPCPEGFFKANASNGSNNTDSCTAHIKCPPGKYTKTAASAIAQPECEVCETGFFKSETSKNSSETDLCIAHTKCPPGQYTSGPGSVISQPTCNTCTTGFYKAHSSRSSMCVGVASFAGRCFEMIWCLQVIGPSKFI